MMSNEERLWKIFDTVNTWLRHADLKNTYLITFYLVAISVFGYSSNGNIFGYFFIDIKNMLETSSSFWDFILNRKFIFIIGIGCWLFSLCISFYSFFPFEKDGYPPYPPRCFCPIPLPQWLQFILRPFSRLCEWLFLLLSEWMFSLNKENNAKYTLLLQHDEIASLREENFNSEIGKLAEPTGNKCENNSLNLLKKMIQINGRIWHVKFQLFTYSFWFLLLGALFLLIWGGGFFKDNSYPHNETGPNETQQVKIIDSQFDKLSLKNNFDNFISALKNESFQVELNEIQFNKLVFHSQLTTLFQTLKKKSFRVKQLIGPFASGSIIKGEEGININDQVCEVRRQLEEKGASFVLVIGHHDKRQLSAAGKKKFGTNSNLARLRANVVIKRLGDKGLIDCTYPIVKTASSLNGGTLLFQVNNEDEIKENLASSRFVEVWGF